MKICMIGTGYVGLVTGTLLADRGNNVICVDNNEDTVKLLKSGKIHIFEPGLEEIVAKNLERKNLSFTSDTVSAVKASDIIFLAVGTPSREDGSFNLEYLKAAARDTGKALKECSGFKVVVGKSTVPQGTYKVMIDTINQELGENPSVEWAYVSNPETLAEGTAVENFSKPDRIIIGTYSDKAFEIMQELYHPFGLRKYCIIKGSPADAELGKLFANTALAARVAMINEFARVADVTKGADISLIRVMVCEDNRIGYNFMFPSPGYGGSCFPKDVQGLVSQAEQDGYKPLLLSQIHNSNEAHKNYIGERVKKLLAKENPVVGIWGVTFKPKTDDMRDSAAIPIITKLLNSGATVKVYDPQDSKAREIFGNKVTFTNNKYDAVDGADALILLTEWSLFDSPDYNELKSRMRGRKLFDLRNRWVAKAANRNGFDYFGIGRQFPLEK